jgi:serine/threonine-protein kinase
MSKICAYCQTSNRDTASFCSGCGNSLQTERTCPNCHTPSSIHASFCLHCGAPLGPSGGSGATGMLPPQYLLVDRYRILQSIGRGGMGAVYLVEDTRLGGKLWAVKEMSDVALTNPLEKQEAIHAFRQEAQMLARLSHTNLPQVSDFFRDQGKHYLVMEFVDGATLGERLLQAGGTLPLPLLLKWADQLCDVLDYLHRQVPPIIFRDLKPDNIMVNQEDQVKLIDFGIARIFKPGKAKDTMAFGTAGYAPPEQYGKGQTDARSDVYALGATLHHLLTDRDPSADPFHFPTVRDLKPSVPTTVDRAIMRALESRPEARWPTIKAFRGALAETAPQRQQRPESKPAKVAYVTPPPVSSLAASASAEAVPSFKADAPEATTAPTLEYAPPVRRGRAYLLDGFFLSILAIGLAMLLGDTTVETAAVLALPLFVIYYTLAHGWRGRTVGKHLTGLRVVRGDGGKLGWGRALWRTLVYIGLLFLGVATYGLVFLLLYGLPFVDKKRRTLHDFLAGTVVIHE